MMNTSSFTSCRIGSCTIKNRFVMTAANLGWCDGGYVNDRVTSFYKERAAGGVGLIIAGAAGIDPVRVNQVGMMQIYDDCFIPAMWNMTEEVHKEGGKIFLQLMHAGAYARKQEHAGAEAVAPSPYRCRFTGEETKEASTEELDDIISCFGKAAGRAKQAGFDGVEVIGSAGYLIAEFLSKSTNHREDAYGGTIEERTAFLLKVIREIRKSAGEDYPLMVRLSGTDFIPGGNGPEEFIAVGRLIEKEVDAINVTGGWHESQVPQITYHVPRGEYLYLAKALKEAVNVPVIGCNRLDAVTAQQAIDNGFCDMAGILRGLIADPCLVKKLEQGDFRGIRPCLACNQDCLERIFSGQDLRCVVNPFAGREGLKRKPALQGKRILVIGAGIAGLAYARLMASGNQVVVREKSGTYGGTGNVVKKIPDREDVSDYIDYLYHECQRAGVTFEWFREVSMKELELELILEDFDRIVIACGASMDFGPYLVDAGRASRAAGVHSVDDGRSSKGAGTFSVEEGAEVISAEECLLHKNPFGKRIVVIGSGYKAVQTVQYLLSCGAKSRETEFLDTYAPEYAAFARKVYETGRNKVTLLAGGEKVGAGFGKSMKWLMMKNLKTSCAEVITEAAVTEIKKDRILYRKGEEIQELPCDLVVIAQGWKSDPVYRKLAEEYPGKILLIGDAKRPGRISEAVGDAFDAFQL